MTIGLYFSLMNSTLTLRLKRFWTEDSLKGPGVSKYCK